MSIATSTKAIGHNIPEKYIDRFVLSTLPPDEKESEAVLDSEPSSFDGITPFDEKKSIS